MKIRYLFLIVFLGIFLSSCAEPRITLPPMNKDVVFIVEEDELVFDKPSENDPEIPFGNYILLRYFSTGGFNQLIYADLYLTDKLVCSWDLGSTLPWHRGEEKLFFTSAEGNCPNLDPRNSVIWYVNQNYANLTFQKDLVGEPKLIDTLLIWALTSEGYKILQ
jgi:hypothetical protein